MFGQNGYAKVSYDEETILDTRVATRDRDGIRRRQVRPTPAQGQFGVGYMWRNRDAGLRNMIDGVSLGANLIYLLSNLLLVIAAAAPSDRQSTLAYSFDFFLVALCRGPTTKCAVWCS